MALVAAFVVAGGAGQEVLGLVVGGAFEAAQELGRGGAADRGDDPAAA
jgi:hypothetical protein